MENTQNARFDNRLLGRTISNVTRTRTEVRAFLHLLSIRQLQGVFNSAAAGLGSSIRGVGQAAARPEILRRPYGV